MNAEEKIHNILEELCREITLVKAIALVNMRKRRLLTEILPPAVNSGTVATVIASVVQIVNDHVEQFERGDIKKLCIKGSAGYIFIHLIGEELALMVFTGSKAHPGKVELNTNKAVEQIAEQLFGKECQVV